MSIRHAICLVVDGLRASALGSYGNTVFPTTQLDALASRAVVADWLWADSPRLEAFYRASFHGRHASRTPRATYPASLFDSLEKIGVQLGAFTDATQFSDVVESLPLHSEGSLESLQADFAAQELETTVLAQFFTAAIEWVAEWRESQQGSSSLAWMHCRGMFGPWDAPLELRWELLDENDPELQEIVVPPRLLKIEEPDELLQYRTAYAAQVIVLDACVGALVAALEEMFADSDTLVMLVGSGGFALGEHGILGCDCESLFGERLHVPWLMTKVGESTPLPRLNSLCQPADIGATLLQWFDPKAPSAWYDGLSFAAALQHEVVAKRTLAVACGADGERVIRTPNWALRTKGQEQQLYSKPDDRWESNDVADRCPEVVEGLKNELVVFFEASHGEKPLPLEPADKELAGSQE